MPWIASKRKKGDGAPMSVIGENCQPPLTMVESSFMSRKPNSKQCAGILKWLWTFPAKLEVGLISIVLWLAAALTTCNSQPGPYNIPNPNAGDWADFGTGIDWKIVKSIRVPGADQPSVRQLCLYQSTGIGCRASHYAELQR